MGIPTTGSGPRIPAMVTAHAGVKMAPGKGLSGNMTPTCCLRMLLKKVVRGPTYFTLTLVQTPF